MWLVLILIVFVLGTFMWATDREAWRAYKRIKFRVGRLLFLLFMPFVAYMVTVTPEIVQRVKQRLSERQFANMQDSDALDKGKLAFIGGQYDQAVTCFSKVTRITEDPILRSQAFQLEGGAFSLWGETLGLRGQKDSAEALFNSALRCYDLAINLNQSSGMAWFSRCCVLTDLGRVHDAKLSYDSAGRYGVDSITALLPIAK